MTRGLHAGSGEGQNRTGDTTIFSRQRDPWGLRLFPDGLLPVSCPRLQTTTVLHGKQDLWRDTAWAMSQENIRRKNGGPGTILGMQSLRKVLV